MCCPTSFWKFFVYVTSGIFALFGIVLLGVGAYVSQKEYAKATEMDGIILGYGIAFGVVMFLVGVTGWYAAKKESRYLVCIVFLGFYIVSNST